MPRTKASRGGADPPPQPQEGRMTRARHRDAVPPPPSSRAEQSQDGGKVQDATASLGKQNKAPPSENSSQPVSSYDPPARRSARVLGERAQSVNLDNIQPSDAANSDYDNASQFDAEDDAESNVAEDEPSSVINVAAAPDEGEGSVSHSQLDDEAVEVQSLVLDDLNQASMALIDQIFREQKPRPEIWKRLIAVHRKPFAEFRGMYVDESVPFINVQDSIKPLSEDLQWKAQGIFASANLVSLLDEISDPSLEPTTLLQRLDQDFPAPFMPWMDEPRLAGREWGVTDSIIKLALSIRTQRLISAVQNMEQFDIEQAAAAMFSAEDDNLKPSEMLVQEKMAAICCFGEPLNDAVAAACYERVTDILTTASRGGTAVEIVNHLREKFPVKGWISEQIDWAYDQFDKVQRILREGQQLAERNGPPSRSVAGSEGSQGFSQFSQPVIRPQRPGNSLRITNSSVAQLMQLQEAAGASQDSQDPAASGDVNTNADETNLDGLPSPRRNHLRATDNARRSPPTSPVSAASNGMYENAILSRLPPSSRLMSSQTRVVDSQPSRPSASSFQSSNSRKHARDDDPFDDDDDEDDEFEQDRRRHDDQRRAERDRRAMPPPPRKRQRHEPGASSSAPIAAPSGSSPKHDVASSSRPSGPRSSFFHDDDFSATSLTRHSGSDPDWRAVQQRNRINAPSPSRGQQRIPWSNRDVSRLIELIPIHGCSWAEIAKSANPAVLKPDDPDRSSPELFDSSRHFDDRRDQQAIRDKARNLKVDFLKADLILPPGFDKVILGKKERQVLISRGKNPERRETDIDDDGNPVDTEYDGFD